MQLPILKTDNQQTITKLTALWALSESGLGGVLHAIKLPFSGLFLASFAVVIITFIGNLSENRRRDILRATLIVVLIKAAASPHSPITAYVAVAFQGFLGAALYSVFSITRVSAALVGLLALVESGLQKLLVLTILFGSPLWEAFEVFSDSVGRQMGIPEGNTSWILISAYLLVYALVGLIAGIWAIRLPENLSRRAKILNAKLMENPPPVHSKNKHRKRKKLPWLWIGVLSFILIIYFTAGSSSSLVYTLIRTAAGIVFFLYILLPVAQYLLKKWVKRKSESVEAEVDQVKAIIPQMRKNLQLAYHLSPSDKPKWLKMKDFFINWLALSLYLNYEQV